MSGAGCLQLACSCSIPALQVQLHWRLQVLHRWLQCQSDRFHPMQAVAWQHVSALWACLFHRLIGFGVHSQRRVRLRQC